MEPATIGFSVIGILQLANFAMTGRVYNKLDQKVSNNLCNERRKTCEKEIASCKESRDERRDRDMEEMHVIERKISRHFHNGDKSVKFW